MTLDIRSGHNSRVVSVLAAFAAAATWEQYEEAKRRAGKLDHVSQLAIVDTIIATRRRIEGGV